MLSGQLGAIEHRLGVTKSVFKPAQKSVEKLRLPISSAPNALYGIDDVTACLIRMSGRESYAGVTADEAREGEADRMRDGADGMRIPTAQWMLGKLREGFCSKFVPMGLPLIDRSRAADVRYSSRA